MQKRGETFTKGQTRTVAGHGHFPLPLGLLPPHRRRTRATPPVHRPSGPFLFELIAQGVSEAASSGSAKREVDCVGEAEAAGRVPEGCACASSTAGEGILELMVGAARMEGEDVDAHRIGSAGWQIRGDGNARLLASFGSACSQWHLVP